MMRKGLGKGLGSGYYNIAPRDPMVHSLSAKGVKTRCQCLLPKLKMPKMTLKASGLESVEVIEEGNMKGEIFVDESPESPREWDNMGTMVAFHKRYDLGDKTDLKSENFDGWDDLKKYLFEEKGAKIVLPLHLYDHSGLRMQVGDFGDRWDSGQVGYIYATADDIRKAYGVKKITADILKKAEKELKGEVETYDQYLSGDVYGYKVTQKNPVEVIKKYPDGSVRKEQVMEEEEIDSVWGYYGIDAVREEVKAVMKSNREKPVVIKGEKQMMLNAKGEREKIMSDFAKAEFSNIYNDGKWKKGDTLYWRGKYYKIVGKSPDTYTIEELYEEKEEGLDAKLTLDRAKNLRYGETVTTPAYKNADGTDQRWVVKGKVKTWKRDPSKIKVPVKRGLYEYGYITEGNLNEFEVE